MQKRVTTLITWSMITGEVLSHQYYEYNGTWMLAKGDSTLKASEQQQASFNAQLQQMMEKQYGLQSAQIQYINSILKPIAENPQGLSPQALAAMRTSASDSIAQQGANAKQAVQTAEAATGGNGLPSGVEAQLNEGLALNTANASSAAQNQITQYDSQVKQTNFWNAVQGLSGTAKMLDPNSYASNANQGSDALANLGTANYQTQQSGWLNAALGGLGAAAGGWASGGFKH